MLPPPLINCAKIKSEQNDPARKLNELSDKKKNTKQNLKQKLLTHWFSGFIAIHFFRRHEVSQDFQ